MRDAQKVTVKANKEAFVWIAGETGGLQYHVFYTHDSISLLLPFRDSRMHQKNAFRLF